jgi:hypothetical protein
MLLGKARVSTLWRHGNEKIHFAEPDAATSQWVAATLA